MSGKSDVIDDDDLGYEVLGCLVMEVRAVYREFSADALFGKSSVCVYAILCGDAWLRFDVDFSNLWALFLLDLDSRLNFFRGWRRSLDSYSVHV